MLDYEKIAEFFTKERRGIHCANPDEAVELLTAVASLFPNRVHAEDGPNPTRTMWEESGPETVYSLDINDPKDMFEYGSVQWHIDWDWYVAEFSEFIMDENVDVDDIDDIGFMSMFD